MYWVRFAAFAATIAAAFVVGSILASLIGMPVAANGVVGALSSIAGIAAALRIFTVPTAPVDMALRDLTTLEIAARLDWAA